jgi:long-chain acyl-CoA synthetase
MAGQKLMLDYIYEHETNRANQVFLTQPFGGDKVVDYTWAQAMDHARRMAAYLKAQGFEPGSRIAILSKNTAQFIMLEVAIWMAGYTTVAIFPTEGPDTIRYVLEHSEAKMIFVGKLDSWGEQESGFPAGLPRVAMPLAPKTNYPQWDDIIAKTQPLAGKPARKPEDLMFIMYTSGSTGTPKGVMHNFERGTAASVAMNNHLEKEIGAGYTYRALSYLPLAHIFERAWISSANLVLGRGHIFFAESLETFVKDVQRAQPTVFISVPRLWLKFQQGVLAKMPQKKLNTLLSIPILSGIVKKKILTGLGLNAVLHAGSGSAPIPPHSPPCSSGTVVLASIWSKAWA